MQFHKGDMIMGRRVIFITPELLFNMLAEHKPELGKCSLCYIGLDSDYSIRMVIAGESLPYTAEGELQRLEITEAEKRPVTKHETLNTVAEMTLRQAYILRKLSAETALKSQWCHY